jgi:exosortase A
MSVAVPEYARGGRRTLCWLGFGALAVVLAVGYEDSWSLLVRTWWTDTTFQHGFLILPLSLFLAWRKREQLARLELRPSWLGLAWLAAALALWLLGRLVHVRVLEQVGLIGALQSLVPLTLGTAATRLLIFPLGFLFFAVPFGTELVPGLMEITADLSVFLLRLTGVPVYREGMLLQIPAGTYEVARACSGIKFLTASVAIGTFFAYVTYRSLRKRLTFIAASIVVAILANGLRAYLLVLIGHLTDMTFRHDRWHIVLGWILYAAILLLTFYIGGRYRDDDAAASRTQPSAGGSPGNPPETPFAWGIVLPGLLLAASAPVLARALFESGGSSGRVAALSKPIVAEPGWTLRDHAPIDWRPRIGGGVSRVEGSYSRDGAIVDVFIEVYPIPAQDEAEMISYRNSIQPDANERLYDDKVVDPGIGALAGFKVRETEAPGQPPRLVWYWFDVDGRTIVSPARAKLAELRTVLVNGLAAQRVVVLSTALDVQRDDARARLEDFVAAHADQLAPGR